jgi:8-oxo-dGTP pyrophosphatase MutT (NUDIX family)
MQKDSIRGAIFMPYLPSRHNCLYDSKALLVLLQHVLSPVSIRSEPAFPEAIPAGVLLPIIEDNNGAPHLLFTARATSLHHHSGEISFPGGRKDITDTTLAETALREAYEEIGLPSSDVSILGQLPQVFTVVSNYLITPIVGLLATKYPFIPELNPAEVAVLIDVPLAVLADPSVAHTEEWARDGLTHIVYFYQFGEHTIWGATGRIVHDFLDLLPLV